MAPEYAMEGLYSIKSDVFSFGVLVIEMITGRRNAGFHFSSRAASLLAYVSNSLWGDIVFPLKLYFLVFDAKPCFGVRRGNYGTKEKGLNWSIHC